MGWPRQNALPSRPPTPALRSRLHPRTRATLCDVSIGFAQAFSAEWIISSGAITGCGQGGRQRRTAARPGVRLLPRTWDGLFVHSDGSRVWASDHRVGRALHGADTHVHGPCEQANDRRSLAGVVLILGSCTTAFVGRRRSQRTQLPMSASRVSPTAGYGSFDLCARSISQCHGGEESDSAKQSECDDREHTQDQALGPVAHPVIIAHEFAGGRGGASAAATESAACSADCPLRARHAIGPPGRARSDARSWGPARWPVCLRRRNRASAGRA